MSRDFIAFYYVTSLLKGEKDPHKYFIVTKYSATKVALFFVIGNCDAISYYKKKLREDVPINRKMYGKIIILLFYRQVQKMHIEHL